MEGRLKWFGHVVRMVEDKKPRQIMEARSERRRTIENQEKLILMA